MKQKNILFQNRNSFCCFFDLFRTLPLCTGFAYSFPVRWTSLTTVRHSMKQTEKYYSACSEVTECVADIRSTLAGYLASAEDKAEYFSQVKNSSCRYATGSCLEFLITPRLLFHEILAGSQQLSVILRFLSRKDRNLHGRTPVEHRI